MREALTQVDSVVRSRLAQETFLAHVTPIALAEAVASYPSRGGKRLRPALVLWSCEAVEGDPATAEMAALAVELYHNWTLIHDDIIDNDDTRRGAPSCHRLLERTAGASLPPLQREALGRDLAILAGDILHAWSVDVLLRADTCGAPADTVRFLAQDLCGRVTPQLIGGEALDVCFGCGTSPTPDSVRGMLHRKTAELLMFAAQAGAIIGVGTADPQTPAVQNLRRFAEAVGLAFQLRDDILGLFGDPETLRKPVGSDVREGKHTLLYLLALERGNRAQREILANALGNTNLSNSDLQRVRRAVRDTGALESVESESRRLVAEAQAHLSVLPASRAATHLAQLAHFAIRRNH